MKTKLYVPLKLSRINDGTREKYLDLLQQANADKVFLAMDRTFADDANEQMQLRAVERETKYLEERGFEVAVWIQSLGFGTPLFKKDKTSTKNFVEIADVEGYSYRGTDAFCPLDENYTSMMRQKVQNLIRHGVKSIMFDDDMCLSIRPGIGCGCDKHMKLFEKRIGHKISNRTALLKKIIEGKPNRYRTEWLELMGETLRNFCLEMRNAADEIDPSVHMGFCAGFTSWDLEGVDAITLTKILAGRTPPFLRLSGAPYWISTHRFPGQSLQGIVEFVRRQQAWCEDENIEIFHEADSFPRPRHNVPASYLEIYDLCLRFSGGIHAMKYMFDYYSLPEYELGYLNAHIRNKAFYDWIDSSCQELHNCGINIADSMHRICDMKIDRPQDKEDPRLHYMKYAFNKTHMFFTKNGIPTCYGKNNENIFAAFGENVKYLDEKELGSGVILDVSAALYLQENGIDVGIKSYKAVKQPYFESFGTNELVHLDFSVGKYYELKLNDGAEVLSMFHDDTHMYPACYYYENDQKQKFVVYAFQGHSLNDGGTVLNSYYRQRQLFDAVKRLHGKVPFTYSGSPGLYALWKENEKRTAILLANVFEDKIVNMELELNKKYVGAKFIDCNGKLLDKKLLIDYISPYGVAGVELKMA